MLHLSILGYSQIWNNDNITVYNLKNLYSYFDCNYFGNSSYISKIENNFYFYYLSYLRNFNLNTFSTNDTIPVNTFPRYFYKPIVSDTIFHNRQSSFGNLYQYFLFKNDSLVFYNGGTITNSFDRMWMGKYYIDLQIDGNSNIIIRDRSLNNIRDTVFNFNPDNLFNYYSFIFNDGSPFSIYNNSNNKPNFRLQHLNDSTCLFTYILGNNNVENTLYTYKIGYHNQHFNVTEITKLNKIEISRRDSTTGGCPNRFVLNDFFYTEGLDSLFVCYVNYKDTIHHFSLGVNGVDFPPESAGVYLFSINEPNAIKKISQIDFTVFPNPSTGELNITAPGNKTVYNYLGQKILETQENKIVLRKGMYVIESGGIRKKVVVE